MTRWPRPNPSEKAYTDLTSKFMNRTMQMTIQDISESWRWPSNQYLSHANDHPTHIWLMEVTIQPISESCKWPSNPYLTHGGDHPTNIWVMQMTIQFNWMVSCMTQIPDMSDTCSGSCGPLYLFSKNAQALQLACKGVTCSHYILHSDRHVRIRSTESKSAGRWATGRHAVAQWKQQSLFLTWQLAGGGGRLALTTTVQGIIITPQHQQLHMTLLNTGGNWSRQDENYALSLEYVGVVFIRYLLMSGQHLTKLGTTGWWPPFSEPHTWCSVYWPSVCHDTVQMSYRATDTYRYALSVAVWTKYRGYRCTLSVAVSKCYRYRYAISVAVSKCYRHRYIISVAVSKCYRYRYAVSVAVSKCCRHR